MSRAPLGRSALAALPIALLLACSSGDVFKVPPPNQGDTSGTTGTTYAKFDPSNGVVPLPNILATATKTSVVYGATSPTSSQLNITANTPLTPDKALAWVNLKEMGSTHAVSGLNAPVYIPFSATVNASTVTASTVKIFQVVPDSASSSATENTQLGFVNVSAMFTYTVSAETQSNGGTASVLQAFPKFPLTPGARYVYVATDGVKDTAGNGLGAATTFSILKYVKGGATSYATDTTNLADTTDTANPAAIAGSAGAALLESIAGNVTVSGQIALSGYRKTMWDLIASSAADTSGKSASATGVAARGNIAVIGRFITTGAGFISPDPVGSPSTRIPFETSLRQFAAGSTLGGLSGKTWSNAVSGFGASTLFVKGGTPSPDTYWQAVTGSGSATAPASVGLVALGTLDSADLNVDPFVANANASTMNLTGTTGAWNPGSGVTQAFRNGSYQLTGFYHTDRTLNFIYIAPDPTLITRPANGYPVVIYQHGITSRKETVIALATSLTASGYALIAIDLPLHGQNAVPGHTTGASWGNDFMAVGAPLATRTNLQQAVVNLTRVELVMKTGGLSTALATNGLATSTPDITTSPSNMRFVGVSLGAITGAYYLASNTTLSSSGLPYTQSSLDNDMKGLLNVPGARTAYLIKASPAFGPSVDAGLAAAGIVKDTATYNAFFQLSQSVVDPADPASLTTPLASGLPSRLSGRVVMQEATSSTFDASGNPTDGDLVITNPYSRYFGNALGGRAVLGTSAAAAVGPNFSQLAYSAGGTYPSSSAAHAAGVVGTPFMFTLSGSTPAPKVANAATSASATTPKEGFFQYDQTSIAHAFIINPANPLAIALSQRQLVYYLKTGLVVDPTQQSGTLPIAGSVSLPEDMIFQAPGKITILGH